MTSKAPSTPHKHSGPDKRILVIGDWTVDEHWVMGLHRSRTSSRVGQRHYRSIQGLDSSVSSFCGAGRTAAILHRAKSGKDNDNPFGIVGLGVWHKSDCSSLEAMLDSSAVKAHTPHQISLSYTPGKKERKLINLVPSSSEHQPGTTRVIRIYQQTGSKIELSERIDWEVKQPPGGWFSLTDLTDHEELRAALGSGKPKSKSLPKIDAIIVKDLQKGVVSSALIRFLAAKLEKVPWFISSKKYLPDWMDKKIIDPNWVYLLEIPQAAAQDAVAENELGAWLTRTNEASKAALDLLDELGRKYQNALIVAVPNDSIVLAHRYRRPGHDKDQKEGAFWTSTQKDSGSVGLPMASVCFTAFTAHLLNDARRPLNEIVDMCLSYTQKWQRTESGRVENPTNWDPLDEARLDLNEVLEPGSTRSIKLEWTKKVEEWQASYCSANYGVIRSGGRQYIDLARSMTEVKNYVCICASKRRVLRELALEIEAFKNQQRTRSCLIEARPGSGKSLLAEMLAQDHGLFFLEFNITQMISKADLLDCFDVISSTQFEKRGTKLLVFVDEIDANLGTGPVYDTFLAPLEQGIYRRAGKTFHIDPCFWLFAGTTNPSHSKKNKASDFVSRLTLKPRSMNTRKSEEFRLENVYLGTAILRLEFPDVREISTEVLKVFHEIKDTVSIRELRQFVKEFTDIKSGEVRRDNVPKGWFEKLGISKIGRPNKLEEMVEIKGEALSPNVFARFTPEGKRAAGSKMEDQEE